MVKVSFDVFFWRRTRIYMERQMQQIATELLPRVATGARDNAIALQESRSQAFIVFFFAVWGYLRSQANLVAIRHEQCEHHA